MVLAYSQAIDRVPYAPAGSCCTRLSQSCRPVCFHQLSGPEGQAEGQAEVKGEAESTGKSEDECEYSSRLEQWWGLAAKLVYTHSEASPRQAAAATNRREQAITAAQHTSAAVSHKHTGTSNF